MNIKDFRKLIRVYFAPKLHEVGFMGTDHHFVKTTDNHFIYTLVIQADKSGGSCVMEMGVHLDFLPNSIGEFKSSNEITTYDCEFRKRLNKKANWLKRFFTVEHERWFQYGKTEDDAIVTINEMKKLFLDQGMSYFSQFNDPRMITSISLAEIIARSKKIEDFGAPLDLRLVLLIARTHKFLGNDRDAKVYAHWGLNNIGEAKGLIKDFKTIGLGSF
ncbi:DUF4304 domain-containing protein [Paenibacillus sp. FSL R5-0766]|uniref:DUF4304 domain-containing protein n=1 Tax=unclassified Paenibacillus TaxID=185978 RepID=UPI00096C8EB1|nr:DUF4304 domain-containing protein [Paenibacillus sp. FSL R5-0765]OMF67259.1 hypothetical protein BK141_00045 [Paenibacillus sp. FSL R5-0765]